MYILGISCFYHDSAAALLLNGQLIAAAAEERFSRKKHDNGFPRQAIQFCLSFAGITGQDLEYVVFYEKPLLKFERILLSTLASYPQSSTLWREAMQDWLREKLWIKSIIKKELGVSQDRILFSEHHISHAASAFFSSPFREAAVLTVDGVGEWTTTALGRATSRWADEDNGTQSVNRIELFDEQKFPHSIGLLYSTFTAYLGFQVNEGEYKVMGMAPYGQPRYLEKIHQIFRQEDDGSFMLNMKYFSFHRSTRSSYNNRFIELFGEPRPPESDFFEHSDDIGTSQLTTRNQRFADIAASIQCVTEDILIALAHQLYKRTNCTKLVMAGGVALNALANYRLLAETPFEDIYIHPAAGDDGGALGAALWAYHIVLGKPRNWVMPHPFWGCGFSDQQCKEFLDGLEVTYKSFEDSEEKLLMYVVRCLLDKKVVALFQGRFEWGPRALGHRSILADPRDFAMKKIINSRIKFREPFRPFAPSILADHTSEYFDVAGKLHSEIFRYMLAVAPIYDHKRESISAVDHFGLARLQSAHSTDNQRYYNLIQAFGNATGIPVLLNTSFNLRGEPIVASLADAWSTFMRSDIDVLVLGSFVVEKDAG